MEPHQIETAICLCDINHNQNKVLRVSLSRYDEVNVMKILEDTNKFENDVQEKSEIDSIHRIDQNVASNNNDEKNVLDKSEIDSIHSID